MSHHDTLQANTVAALRKARELYAANPSHVRGGNMPEAGTYCIVTAITATDFSTGYEPVAGALRAAAGCEDLAYWNANQSTAEVLAAFDRAIAAQEASAA